MPDKFILKGVSIAPGESRQVDIKIARLPTHTSIELPVYVNRGSKPGPVLLLTAGLHGNETNGIETVRRMLREKLINPQKGTVIAIPIVNVYGFLQFARYLPDGKDLNRSFPGNKTGSLAKRVAWVLMNDILPLIDYGIDFHTGGASVHNYPQIRCDFKFEANRKLADMFRAPLIMHSGMIDKSFRKAAHKMGKHIIVFEGGESLRFDDQSIQAGIDGTLRLMHGLGMTDDAPETSIKPVILKSSSWVRARYSGLFRAVVQPGEKIKRNQLIGTITDPYGETVYSIKSRESGYVISLNHMPILNAGDAILHLGKTTESKNSTGEDG